MKHRPGGLRATLAWGSLLVIVALATPFLGSARLAAQQRLDSIHGALPRGLDCSACHTVEGWKPPRSPMDFTHGAVSGFQLAGKHVGVSCRGCHVDLRFDRPKVTPTECAGCHQDPHSGHMLQDCASCHTTESFAAVDGNRVHTLTSFPLTGSHRSLDCESCHVDDRGGSFSSLPTNCAACHLPDYRSARTVDHQAAGYTTDCTSCHGTVGWQDAIFDHVAASRGFALIGAHQTLRCSSCHAVPGPALLFPEPASPQDCVACHQREYDARHVGTGFPTTCLTCHTPNTWSGATVDHVSISRGFQLLGAHAAAQCADCHTVPGYALRFPPPSGQQDCVACHRTDYDRAHAARGYPTTCSTCHTVSSWASTFDHDGQFFPINSGTHREKWATCATCHTTPSTFTTFTCLSCHEHSKPLMDEKHKERAGYQYESSACYSCHRNEL